MGKPLRAVVVSTVSASTRVASQTITSPNKSVRGGDEPVADARFGDQVLGAVRGGFQLARQVLNREKGANRQIIVITDGEPTAHFDDGHVRFSYPPTPRTFQETLREVIRCTRDGITINTFMLEQSHALAAFVEQMTRINRGRAFFATSDRLGEYVLVDFVRAKRRAVS